MPTIYDVVMNWAVRSPERPALTGSEGSTVTYLELSRALQWLGALLARLGLARPLRLATVIQDGVAAAAAFLGVSRYATAAPLNPAYGERDFETHLSELAVDALLVEESFATPARDAAQAIGIPLIGLPTDLRQWRSPARRSDWHPGCSPEDVALLLCTSGTTSRPKRVPLTHANLMASARSIAQSLYLREDECCLNPMPLFHIHGLVAGLLAPLLAGGCVISAPSAPPEALVHWINSREPTWYTGVPTVHQAILAEVRSRPQAPTHRLRFIRSCSASLPPSLLADMESTFDVPVVEAYGMTEASHQIATNPLPPGTRKPGSVGLPTGAQLRILPSGREDAGDLMRGEIAIRGRSVTKGYEANPAANQEAFVDGWFRTGDEGFLDEDGYVHLTGRVNEMLNRGGEKVAPQEIDEALLAHEAIKQAVAFAVPHPSLGEDVAAAVVLKRKGSCTEGELRAYLLERIAGYKVPSRFVFVDEIPEGPTGKPQRIELAVRLEDRLADSYSRPESPLEVELAGIWADVLNVNRIGRNDNFFALGGDSLSAARVLTRVNRLLGTEMGLQQMFEAPRLREQAIRVLANALAESGGRLNASLE